MLYKPFRADRLMEAVEQALRTATTHSQTHPAAAVPAPPTDGPAAGKVASPPPTQMATTASHRTVPNPPSPVMDHEDADSRPIETTNHES